MRAEFKGYLVTDPSSEVDLDSWAPENPEDFALTLDFHAGVEGESWAEAFSVSVCSPNRFFREHGDAAVSAENVIFMRRFDGPELIRFLVDRCAQTKGESWNAIAVQLARLGRWEFGYRLK